MTEAISTAANVVPLAAIAGSLVTLWWLFQRHIAGEPLLPYEPRRPVPWNAAAPIALLAFVLMPTVTTVISDLTGSIESIGIPPAYTAMIVAFAANAAAAGGPVAEFASVATASMSQTLWTSEPPVSLSVWAVASQPVLSIALTFACQVALFSLYGASRRDLGWPSNWTEARRDLAAGLIAFLAVLAPVYVVQDVLTRLLSPETMHPLIEELQLRLSSSMLLAAFAAAVIGAPLLEETTFRVILQGWLERLMGPWTAQGGRRAAVAMDYNEVPPTPVSDPREPVVWSPLVISSILFAFAHYGHGVAPISLLLLGFVLGYLYQRTHRIVASMACHAAFNAFTLLQLWLILTSRALTQ